ncbi:zinc-binding dehydrogenase [Wohlfahrtiimonas larvae]|uniref:Zn-dependent alcohol dehydrogenase n=1 Tax=Wohlfahrtiimonas larvae TaxID=1157986 RepID=A0ABP9MEH5_9GAMM|nr:zinc-binding dehydrogenase [Wohlfahrtiimonas larvae]
MKASVIREFKTKFVTEEISIDNPVDYEVLVDVKASGLCHSDLHILNNGEGQQAPLVAGHEIAGVVSAVGDRVTEFKVGDHVAACVIQYCGCCDACLSGHSYQCLNKESTLRSADQPPRLSGKDGKPIFQLSGIAGFAEKALIHQNQLVKIPVEMPFPQACIMGCATATGAGAMINTAKIRPGDSVVVVGLGGVGLNAVSGARICGASKIIAVDIQDSKLELAKKFGATHTINSTTQNVVDEVMKITNGIGVDAAFEVIGLVPTTMDALNTLRLGGSLYLIGLFRPNQKLEIDGSVDLIYPNRNIKTIWMGSTNIKKDLPMYAQYYLDGRLNLDDLISREIHIDDVQKAYDDLATDKLGIARSVITSFD